MPVITKRDRTEWPDGYGKPSVVVPAGTILHAGHVLGTHVERGVRVMSDVWEDVYSAEIWDVASGTIKLMGVGVSGFGMDAEVVADAPAADYAAAFDYLVARHETRLLAARENRVDAAVSAAHRVAVGREIVVVKGRKVPKGTAGTAFWVGETTWGKRVGFKDAAGATHWTALSNVEVTDAWEHFDYELWAMTPDKSAGIKRDAIKAALADAADRRWVTPEAAKAASDVAA